MTHAGGGHTPRVAVIVTTYNHEAFIAGALDSVLAQSMPEPFEIIVIEDRSTDRTREIVLDFHRRHPGRFRLLLAEQNQCDNAAFVEAVATTDARYLALLDGDDYWTSAEKLATQADYLDAHQGCAVVHHAVDLVDHSGAVIGARVPGNRIATAIDLVDSCLVTTCAAMVRRSSIAPLPPWYTDEDNADWSLFLLAAGHGTVDSIPGSMAAYRIHSGGFWSSQPRLIQLRRVLDFYNGWLARPGTRLAPRIATLAAHTALDIASEHEDGGELDLAERARNEARRLEPDERRRHWTLRVVEPAVATMTTPGNSDSIEVTIERASRAPYDVQLNRRWVRLAAGRRYTVRVRATSATGLRVAVGMARAHEPWNNVGLYHEAMVVGDGIITASFVSAEDISEARIHLDVGFSCGTLHIHDVSIIESEP